ncbi:MAG: response regulator transcription factor [Ornithinibacter sp.]
MARVLVVDDDVTVREVVVSYLRAAGHEVVEAADGAEALRAMRSDPADLVVLDLMMPGIDGLEVCRRLRASGDVPIVMLTALGAEVDRVVGLESGADDYVTKPFSPRELVLRVQAVLRRAAPETGAAADDAREGTTSTVDVSADGDLVLDRRAHVVTRGGRELALTAREFALLDWFLSHPGVVHRREELMREVWGWQFGDESTVTVHVRRLREKVEAEPSAPRRLVTVFGVGYRWDARPPGAP